MDGEEYCPSCNEVIYDVQGAIRRTESTVNKLITERDRLRKLLVKNCLCTRCGEELTPAGHFLACEHCGGREEKPKDY